MDHQYHNTSIYVRDPQPGLWDPAAADPDPDPARRAAGGAVGNYEQIVFRHLDHIRAFPAGAQFLTALTNAGKRQIINFIGTNVTNDNSCSGSGAGKKKIVSRMGSGWSGEARAAFEYALTGRSLVNPGQGDVLTWLAGRMLSTPTYHWDPATNSANSPLNPAGVGPGNPNWAGMVAALAMQLGHYRSGAMSMRKEDGLNGEVFDLMVWCLRDDLEDGTGSNCLIRYTPLKVAVGGGARPAQIALCHELVHALREATGSNLSAEDSTAEWNGRFYELAAVGLAPFNAEPYSENVFRGLFNVALRAAY